MLCPYRKTQYDPKKDKKKLLYAVVLHGRKNMLVSQYVNWQVLKLFLIPFILQIEM